MGWVGTSDPPLFFKVDDRQRDRWMDRSDARMSDGLHLFPIGRTCGYLFNNRRVDLPTNGLTDRSIFERGPRPRPRATLDGGLGRHTATRSRKTLAQTTNVHDRAAAMRRQGTRATTTLRPRMERRRRRRDGTKRNISSNAGDRCRDTDRARRRTDGGWVEWNGMETRATPLFAK